jgi:hypothetical protein
LIAKENGQYYLVDKSGNKISETGFDDAKMFVDSYAAVKIGDKWGYLDSDGNMIVDCVYQDAKSFSNGLAAVCNENLWGYITYDAESEAVQTAIDYSFYDAQNFSQTNKCAFVKIDDVWKLLKLYSE